MFNINTPRVERAMCLKNVRKLPLRIHNTRDNIIHMMMVNTIPGATAEDRTRVVRLCV